MKFYFFIFFMYSFLLHGQSIQHKEIDRLLDSSKQQFAESNILESLKLAEKAQNLSEDEEYSKGITIANIHIANLLSDIGIYDNAFHFLKRVTHEPFFISDVGQQSEFHRVRARIYFNLRLYKLSIEEYQSTLTFSNKIKDTVAKDMSMFLSYHNLAYVYGYLNMFDQASQYLKHQEEALKKFNINEAPYSYGMYYINMAQYYLYQKQYKEAKSYLDKAMDLYKQYKSNPVLSNPRNRYGDLELAKYRYPSLFDLFNRYGKLELATGNSKQAIDYFRYALDDMLKVGDMTAAKAQYKTLADYFTAEVPDKEQADKYMYNYQHLSDSLDGVNKQINEIVMDDILEYNEVERLKKKKIFIYTIIGLVLMTGSIGGFYFILNRRKKRVIGEQKAILTEKDILTEELEKQIEENKFLDLINMAKKNKPEFIILFKELYPGFIQKLRNLDPNIRSSELSFCAMAYLNFSTKDIADYTFVTIRAVQIRKNRFRKKFKIPSDQDFNDWMRKL